jgi:hypothetical protein
MYYNIIYNIIIKEVALMLAIRNGNGIVFIKDGDILRIRPNPKFERNGVKYGAILWNSQPIGVYPLDVENENDPTVYSVFSKICDALVNGNRYVNMPYGYQFESSKEFEEYMELNKSYTQDKLFSMYYNDFGKVRG